MAGYKLVVLALLAALYGCQSRDPAAMEQAQALDSLQCFVRQAQAKPGYWDIKKVRDLAESGNRDCQVVLGRWYEGGVVLAQDYSKARALYQSIAEQDPRAYVLLGGMAEEGRGGPVDFGQARQWYRQAAKGDGHSGSLELARLVEEGKGAPADAPQALALYIAASQQYEDEAWMQVRRLRRAGLQVSPAQTQAYNAIWLQGVLQKRDLLRDRTVRRLLGDLVEPATVQVDFEFTLGSGIPKVAIAQASVNQPLDDAVLKVAGRVRMNDDFLPVDGSEVLRVRTPFVFR